MVRPAQLIAAAALAIGLVFEATALQDPTRPTDPDTYFGRAAPQAGNWMLQSILSSNDRRIAIVNGTPVRVGDRLGSAKVVQIEKTQVVLNTGASKIVLRLLPDSIKVNP